MTWTEAEAAIRAHIETQWALGSYAALPLVFEAEPPAAEADHFVAINIEGTFADKTIYGSVDKRSSTEGGIVFVHCFSPIGGGKAAVTEPIDAMVGMLELQTIQSVIKMDGADPPTPVAHGDDLQPSGQPAGNYYRCSSSIPFIVVSTR